MPRHTTGERHKSDPGGSPYPVASGQARNQAGAGELRGKRRTRKRRKRRRAGKPKRAAEVGVGKLTRVNGAAVACPASPSERLAVYGRDHRFTISPYSRRLETPPSASP